MGDRANYVIVENGSWHLHYSHWGAVGLDLDLLPGPAAATRFVRAQRTVTRWLDDVWCEGAALIDHDRRLLLWFSTHLDDYAYRAAALAVLARTWPGRRLEWAGRRGPRRHPGAHRGRPMRPRIARRPRRGDHR